MAGFSDDSVVQRVEIPHRKITMKKIVPKSKVKQANEGPLLDKLRLIIGLIICCILFGIAIAVPVLFTIFWSAPGFFLAIGVIEAMVHIAFIGQDGCCGFEHWATSRNSKLRTAIIITAFLGIILISNGEPDIIDTENKLLMALWVIGIPMVFMNFVVMWFDSNTHCCC